MVALKFSVLVLLAVLKDMETHLCLWMWKCEQGMGVPGQSHVRQVGVRDRAGVFWGVSRGSLRSCDAFMGTAVLFVGLSSSICAVLLRWSYDLLMIC